jgi:hypothetical protein
MTEHEIAVVTAMKAYGGSFVQALATAYERADENNFIRLRRAFPEYWMRYSRIAKEGMEALPVDPESQTEVR